MPKFTKYPIQNDFEASFYTIDTIDSTMDGIKLLLARDNQGQRGSNSLKNPRAVALRAQEQSAGRGRRNQKIWSSPANAGIYCTIAIQAGPWNYYWKKGSNSDSRKNNKHISLVGIKTALGIAHGLEEIGIEASIKWPNDVLVQGKKIAGILVEHWRNYFIIGFGINTSVQAYSVSLSKRAIALEELLSEFSDSQIEILELSFLTNTNKQQFINLSGDQLNRLTSFFLNQIHHAFLNQNWCDEVQNRLFGKGHNFAFENLVIDPESLNSSMNGELETKFLEAEIMGINEQGMLRIKADQQELSLIEGSFNPFEE
jgi:biotin-[acetyl-CoA-carboxylase] ligase BirA-like protein